MIAIKDEEERERDEHFRMLTHMAINCYYLENCSKVEVLLDPVVESCKEYQRVLVQT